MNINTDAYNRLTNRFAGLDQLTSSTAVVNLKEGMSAKGVQSTTTFHDHNIFRRLGRSQAECDANKAARDALLRGLARTFDLKMNSNNFMDELRQRLGDDVLKSGDFGLKNGVVTSTQPLTKRRVQAIMTKVGEIVNGEVEGEKKAIEDHPGRISVQYLQGVYQVSTKAAKMVSGSKYNQDPLPITQGFISGQDNQPIIFDGKVLYIKYPPNDGNCFFTSALLAQGNKEVSCSNVVELRMQLNQSIVNLCNQSTPNGTYFSSHKEGDGPVTFKWCPPDADFKLDITGHVRDALMGKMMATGCPTSLDDGDGAFLAHCLNRPVIVYTKEVDEHGNNHLAPLKYEHNLLTGEKLTNKPIELYFDNGHFMAIDKLVDAQ